MNGCIPTFLAGHSCCREVCVSIRAVLCAIEVGVALGLQASVSSFYAPKKRPRKRRNVFPVSSVARMDPREHLASLMNSLAMQHAAQVCNHDGYQSQSSSLFTGSDRAAASTRGRPAQQPRCSELSHSIFVSDVQLFALPQQQPAVRPPPGMGRAPPPGFGPPRRKQTTSSPLSPSNLI